MGRNFLCDIVIRGKRTISVIISPWANFLWGRHFNVTPAESSKSHCVESLSIAPLRPVLHRPTLE